MQESDALKVTLEIKEKELLALEEKLSARERVSFLTPLSVWNVSTYSFSWCFLKASHLQSNWSDLHFSS